MASELMEKLSNLFTTLKAEEDDEPEEEEEEEEDEEDLIDPATAIKEACAENACTSYKARLDECEERVKSKTKTTETCFEEILDFYHCVDHCAAKDIFKHVK
jgi:ubiquinol-cytochrome c reductase subunit 6